MKDLIEDLLERFDVPGAAVAVVHGDDVVVSDGFGTADLATSTPVTPDTAFAIGSVTKAFTAAGVAAPLSRPLSAPGARHAGESAQRSHHDLDWTGAVAVPDVNGPGAPGRPSTARAA